MPNNCNKTINVYDETHRLLNVPKCKYEGTFAVPLNNSFYFTCEKHGNYFVQKIYKCNKNCIFDNYFNKFVKCIKKDLSKKNGNASIKNVKTNQNHKKSRKVQ